jgi:hypothetical protein
MVKLLTLLDGAAALYRTYWALCSEEPMITAEGARAADSLEHSVCVGRRDQIPKVIFWKEPVRRKHADADSSLDANSRAVTSSTVVVTPPSYFMNDDKSVVLLNTPVARQVIHPRTGNTKYTRLIIHTPLHGPIPDCA